MTTLNNRIRLQNLAHELEENKQAISVLKAHGYELEHARLKLLNQIVLEANPSLTGWTNITLAHDTEQEWGCDKSPTGLCVYDDNADPAHNNCLFCGEPEERK